MQKTQKIEEKKYDVKWKSKLLVGNPMWEVGNARINQRITVSKWLRHLDRFASMKCRNWREKKEENHH